jgi:WD40 repeat protein
MSRLPAALSAALGITRLAGLIVIGLALVQARPWTGRPGAPPAGPPAPAATSGAAQPPGGPTGPAGTMTAIVAVTVQAWPGGPTPSPPAITPIPMPTIAPFVWPGVAVDTSTAAQIRLLTRWGYGWATDVEWSPDGEWLAVATPYGVRLYAAAPLREQRVLDTASQAQSVAVVSPEPGRLLVAAALSDGTVQLWDAANGSVMAVLQTGHPWMSALVFAPDGRVLAAASTASQLTLWDIPSGQLRHQLTSGTGLKANQVVFSPGGERLATQGDGGISVWDVETGALLQTLEISLGGGLTFAPDGQAIALGLGPDAVAVLELPDGQIRWSREGLTSSVDSLTFSPDGSTLVGASNQEVHFWQARDGTELSVVAGRQPVFRPVTLAPGGSAVAIIDPGEGIVVWDPASVQPVASFGGYAGGLAGAAFARSQPWLALSSYGGIARVWDVPAAREIAAYPARWFSENAVTISPDGAWLVSGGESGVMLWELATGRGRGPLDLQRTWSLAFSPDGRYLAGGGALGAKRWETASGRELQLYTAEPISAVAFAPDGTALALETWDRTVQLWDVASGELRATLPIPSGDLGGLAFSPDGTLLAAGIENNGIMLWDLPAGRSRQVLTGHADSVTGLAFSLRGDVLASADYQGRIYLWDVAAGEPLATLDGPRDAVTGLAFSPDGALLVTADGVGAVWLWGVTGK